ncbi:hypothetical protein [Paludisphaera soli]|uniref:hypothetical protein n=1 Tax=Paludisphaera soli TaxID=2712865 RepID=UPI0013EC65DF|nr:hypothetical protein [Paludisphaera soli]
MTVSLTTLKLVCELASVWMVGIVAIVAFVVVAVDRLNVRIAELEERIRVLSGEPARPTPAPAARRRADSRPGLSTPSRSWSWSGSRC